MIKLKQFTDAGTAASLDVGTGANQVLQLDSNAKIPAVDGSLITGLSGGGGGGGTAVRTIVSADISTANYQIGTSLNNGSVIVVNNTSNVARDIYLPTASSYSAGFYLFVARSGGTNYPGYLKPHPSSSDTINRTSPTFTLGIEDCQVVVSDGSSKWITISQGQI